MNPASIADNKRRVREELRRMALDELRGARPEAGLRIHPRLGFQPNCNPGTPR
jgi:hypothetical protein